MNRRRDKRARAETVADTPKSRTEQEAVKQMRPRPTPVDHKAQLGALAVQVAERTGLALGPRYTADEMQMLDTMHSMARDNGRAFGLHDFASILLRGSARDYGEESEAWGPEARRLERHAWMYVREQLANQRETGCNLRDVINDGILAHLDIIIERLK